MSYDWLIIGGGIHGVHIAARLIRECGVDPERLCIVDPAPRLLARWRQCTGTTGMTHLRSPSVHHIDVPAMALQQFAGRRRSRRPGLFAGSYQRPSLALFDAHCDHVIDVFGLAKCHLQDRVIGCSVHCEGVRVRLAGGDELSAQNLVLALGASEQPRWPDWAPRDDARVQHVFAPSFEGWASAPGTLAVVGGGISASQVALRLRKEGHRVHLVSRHAHREHEFDSDPGWLGPKYMTGYRREPRIERRRAMITAARHAGSVPSEVRRAIVSAVSRGDVVRHAGGVLGVSDEPNGVTLRLDTGASVHVDRVLLATGFDAARPGGEMVDELIASAALPCASCGYPVVDSALRWHPRIHVSGPLAELEIGPAARNIAGARRAGDRIVDAIRAGAAV